jgi:hypothetical protein
MMRLGLIHRPHPARPRLGVALQRLAAPETADWHRAIPLDGDALGNDLHANCVPCAALRSIQMRRAVVAHDHRRPTAEQALALYRAWAGWDGTDATDTGTPSDQAALHWRRDGIQWCEQYEDVPSIAALDVANRDHIRAAIAVLGPIQIDLAMPRAWEQEPSTWTVVSGSWGEPGSWGAHRVCAGRYDAYGPYVVTWGVERHLMWPALALYGLGAEATVSRTWLDTMGRSPAGLDLDALEAEAAALVA